MSESVRSISDATFEQEVLKASVPVLVDYWAPWCGPCRMVAPVLDDLANEYGDRIKILKLNIDESPDAPSQFGVRGTPTLMLFKNGQVQGTRVGALLRAQLSTFIEEHL